MSKKKWAYIILIALALLAWYKLFYKTYNVKYIPANVNAIITIDKKRIINTLLWQFITTPSQWKFSSSSAKKDSTISWQKVIALPDYISLFHIIDQPNSVWHTCLPIKNHVKINYFLQQQGFKNISGNEFVHEANNIWVTIKEGILIISSTKVTNKELHTTVVTSIFDTKKTITESRFKKIRSAKSHVAAMFFQNSFLKEDAIVKANFDKEKIQISSVLTPASIYRFNEYNFSFSPQSLLNLHFTHPTKSVYQLLNVADKDKISKILNFTADSFFLESNKYYQLNIDSFVYRRDSAVSYTYDEEFNKIEKIIINNVQEPVYHFTLHGDQVNNIFTYWQQAKLMEQTANGNLFTPIPFVKSYGLVNQNQLFIQPYKYKRPVPLQNFTGILYLRILLSKIPSNFLNYLPGKLKDVISNLDDVTLSAQNKENAISIECIIRKKKNDSPLFVF